MNKFSFQIATALSILMSAGIVSGGETATVIIKDYKFVPEEIIR